MSKYYGWFQRSTSHEFVRCLQYRVDIRQNGPDVFIQIFDTNYQPELFVCVSPFVENLVLAVKHFFVNLRML